MSESPIDPEDELLIEGAPIPAAEREWQDADGDIGASELPNQRSADELERRRRSELAGQKRAVEEARTGDGSERVLPPREEAREGWPAPQQSDTPAEWPEPTVD